MDVNGLLKGIEEFFINILPKAYNSSGWTDDSLTNAFHWADFCEQIYKKYENNYCRKKLDELIHSLFASLSHGNQEICFKDLKNSTDVLCKAFYENPCVENHIIESILLNLKKDELCLEEIKERHNLDSLCIELLEALKPVKITNSDRSFYSEVKAAIYLETLKTTVLHMTSEEEVENYLSLCLEKLCENTDKMEQLLQILLLKSSEETLSSTIDIQEFAINWTMYKILCNKNSPLALFIWKHPLQLRRLSLNNHDFLSFYLDFLTECASQLTSLTTEDKTEWISRSSDIGILSFYEILDHFRSLLDTDDDVCEATKKHLVTAVNTQPESTAWKEIFSSVT